MIRECENERSTDSEHILLKKRMHRAEIFQKWIYIPLKIRRFFPLGSIVTVKVGERVMRMKINQYGYMSPETDLWDDFAKSINFDKHSDILVFVRHKDGSLEIRAEKPEEKR